MIKSSSYLSQRPNAAGVVPYTEHYPPDTTACIFWLKNRQKAAWRDRQEVEHSGKVSLEELVSGSFDGK